MAAVPDHSRGTARGICGLMMFSGDDALKRVDVLSGGERARVLLGKLLVSPTNLVLLDEPTNHLDMESIESLIDAVEQFPGGAIVVTHNERVLHALATKLVVFDRDTVTWFDGTYRDFLDRVGWSDEDEKPKATSKGAPKADKSAKAKDAPKRQSKESRKARAEIVNAKSRALRPLQKRVHDLEDTIVALEPKLETTHKELEIAAQNGDAAAIQSLSKESAELQKEIETLFAELESATIDHDVVAKEYDDKLTELEG